MKKIKRKKTKSNPLIIVGFGFMLVFFYLVSAAACTRGADRMEVQIEVENPHAIDFEKYDKILYQDLALDCRPKTTRRRSRSGLFSLSNLPKISTSISNPGPVTPRMRNPPCPPMPC